ncbi:MAG: hypothetical protein KF884_12370 [Fimbriimonadaceae bacterium]|nr:hypothetical protein [Fimbriimonadaceae bacterium]QYK58337.1 MAG: hypothetical protein KF884_12370 [Fimbriimonadaceae bacterium]
MSRLSPKDFIGSRTKFVRMSDNAQFLGWVVNFSGQCLEIETTTEHVMSPGDRFLFDVVGRRSSACCEATLTEVENFDPTGQGNVSTVQGSDIKIIEANSITLSFRIEGTLRYTRSEDAFRIRTSPMPVVIKGSGQPISASVVDVGERGFGFVSSVIFEPSNTPISFEVSTPIGVVLGKGVIRYCEPAAANSGRFRGGVLMTELGRLDAPRWLRFVREMS